VYIEGTQLFIGHTLGTALPKKNSSTHAYQSSVQTGSSFAKTADRQQTKRPPPSSSRGRGGRSAGSGCHGSVTMAVASDAFGGDNASSVASVAPRTAGVFEFVTVPPAANPLSSLAPLPDAKGSEVAPKNRAGNAASQQPTSRKPTCRGGCCLLPAGAFRWGWLKKVGTGGADR